MARKNMDLFKAVSGKVRPNKSTNANANAHSPKVHSKNFGPPVSTKGETVTQRLSPCKISSPPVAIRSSPRSSPGSGSPRSSPGFSAGLYAGCKWSEPPSPASLPLPPQHWTQGGSQSSTISGAMLSCISSTSKSHDIAHQLKVLLKVNA